MSLEEELSQGRSPNFVGEYHEGKPIQGNYKRRQTHHIIIYADT